MGDKVETGQQRRVSLVIKSLCVLINLLLFLVMSKKDIKECPRLHEVMKKGIILECVILCGGEKLCMIMSRRNIIVCFQSVRDFWIFYFFTSGSFLLFFCEAQILLLLCGRRRVKTTCIYPG